MRVIIFTYPLPVNLGKIYEKKSGDFLIGVDGTLDELKFKVDLAVGDFDTLKDHSKLEGIQVVKLNTQKDETDTKKAIQIAMQMAAEEIILYGGVGGNRPEHFIANLFLLNETHHIKIVTDTTTIFKLGLGVHVLDKKDVYYSFFALEKTVISLLDFKYPLDDYDLELFDPLCISNELISDHGTVIISQGKVIAFETKKD